MGWQISSGVNDGYPLHTDNVCVPVTAMSSPYPNGIMRLHASVNDGYPHLFWMDVPLSHEGVNHLYYGNQQPQKLYYGAVEATACYYGDQLVYCLTR